VIRARCGRRPSGREGFAEAHAAERHAPGGWRRGVRPIHDDGDGLREVHQRLRDGRHGLREVGHRWRDVRHPWRQVRRRWRWVRYGSRRGRPRKREVHYLLAGMRLRSQDHRMRLQDAHGRTGDDVYGTADPCLQRRDALLPRRRRASARASDAVTTTGRSDVAPVVTGLESERTVAASVVLAPDGEAGVCERRPRPPCAPTRPWDRETPGGAAREALSGGTTHGSAATASGSGRDPGASPSRQCPCMAGDARSATRGHDREPGTGLTAA
jgi:hypothetical protein